MNRLGTRIRPRHIDRWLALNSTAVIPRSSVTKHPTAPLPVANESRAHGIATVALLPLAMTVWIGSSGF
jgi:hypothetical protein